MWPLIDAVSIWYGGYSDHLGVTVSIQEKPTLSGASGKSGILLGERNPRGGIPDSEGVS